MAEDEPSESNRDKKEDLINLLGTKIRSRRIAGSRVKYQQGGRVRSDTPTQLTGY